MGGVFRLGFVHAAHFISVMGLNNQKRNVGLKFKHEDLFHQQKKMVLKFSKCNDLD